VRCAILGFGLIGGSIARALRRDGGEWSIAAWSPRGTGPRQAVADDIVEVAAPSVAEAVTGAELIILAAPPLACLALLHDLAGLAPRAVRPGALVTDVASTKVAIVERAAALRLPFVGGHPMAGRETSGFGAATDDLFRDRPWVIVPGDSAPPGGPETVEALALACGARPVRMDAAAHDAATAAVSHLPLVVAAALVEAVIGTGTEPNRADWPAVAGLAATGWSGATRLAVGDPTMAAGIAATNAPAIAVRLRDLLESLDGWLEELESPAPDSAVLERRFRAARDRLEHSRR
jgi:prephenate dehydrogenase